MNRLTSPIALLLLLLTVILAGCRRQQASQLPESREAKRLLQGVWTDGESDEVVFQMRGDSV